MITTYRLEQPILGWAKGEYFSYNESWNEWTRKKTGEELNYRGNILQGERALLLNLLVKHGMTTILSVKQRKEELMNGEF